MSSRIRYTQVEAAFCIVEVATALKEFHGLYLVLWDSLTLRMSQGQAVASLSIVGIAPALKEFHCAKEKIDSLRFILRDPAPGGISSR
jgi:hypothetical protein